MTTSINTVFRGIPPILNRIWRTREGDWFKAGSAFAIEIKNSSPHGIDPKEWAESLSAAIANVSDHKSGASCKAVRNWLTVHYPDLMETISDEEAQLLSEGVEGMV